MALSLASSRLRRDAFDKSCDKENKTHGSFHFVETSTKNAYSA
jgi:hypothetical protein